MMRSYRFNKFINLQRKEKNMQKYIQIINQSPISIKPVRRRKRAPEETVLMFKAIMKDIKYLENKGIMRKNGRKWTFNI